MDRKIFIYAVLIVISCFNFAQRDLGSTFKLTTTTPWPPQAALHLFLLSFFLHLAQFGVALTVPGDVEGPQMASTEEENTELPEMASMEEENIELPEMASKETEAMVGV